MQRVVLSSLLSASLIAAFATPAIGQGSAPGPLEPNAARLASAHAPAAPVVDFEFTDIDGNTA